MTKCHYTLGEITPILPLEGERRMTRPEHRPSHALLVEDDPFMRSAVADFLHDEMAMTVHLAKSYEEARGQFAAIATNCALALVDISLPQRNESEPARRPFGIQLVREIKQKKSQCGVVLWSAYTHFLPDIMKLIAEGHRGLAYVPKGSRVQVLQNAVNQVIAGDVFLHRTVLGEQFIDAEQALLASLEPEVAEAVEAVAQRLPELSPRQLQVVERITSTPVSIAQELNLEVRTVRNYQDTIYDRLGFRNATGAAQNLRRDPVIILALMLYRIRQSGGQ